LNELRKLGEQLPICCAFRPHFGLSVGPALDNPLAHLVRSHWPVFPPIGSLDGVHGQTVAGWASVVKVTLLSKSEIRTIAKDDIFGISTFGFLSTFGFRPSGFGGK
jgi:hypothetical protein